jgi:hypothetical protein
MVVAMVLFWDPLTLRELLAIMTGESVLLTSGVAAPQPIPADANATAKTKLTTKIGLV